ncbi:hypothetical protein HPB50_004090 [Hyalomma asiaticum]|uniref:Uncharacterized protein n=1 Tax=Hyalomma asiaticum TaxID=266040 RepID=A0ACB7TAM8_HYAAI|nr:hypothetical protein HPB50_004090 [Hyalomma asiaticum]
MLPEKLHNGTASRFARLTGSGIGERLQLTEQDMTGRGYAISCMVAARHTMRTNPMTTQRDAKDMWRPRARNPCAKGAGGRQGGDSSGGGGIRPFGCFKRKQEGHIAKDRNALVAVKGATPLEVVASGPSAASSASRRAT